MQVVFNPQASPAAHAVAADVRSEYVVQVKGTVDAAPRRARRTPTCRPARSRSSPTSRGAQRRRRRRRSRSTRTRTIDEVQRLRYRYLDLRRERMHENLVLRDRTTQFMRHFLNDQGFLEIETPILTKPTPEGARDYLVPSRVHAGHSTRCRSRRSSSSSC